MVRMLYELYLESFNGIFAPKAPKWDDLSEKDRNYWSALARVFSATLKNL